MKKRQNLLVLCIICLLAVIAVIGIENDVLRIEWLHDSQKETGNEQSMGNKADSEENNTTENNKRSNILYTNGIEIELINCEMIEDVDIENQTKYCAEYFYSGELPDAKYLKEYTDYEAIKKECPELCELWENGSNSVEEMQEVYNRNLDIISKHTTMKHPKTRYFFVECRITNPSTKMNETCLDLDIFIKSEEEYLDMQECTCYFDKAVNLEGDERTNRFFWYPFAAGEVLECVIGFEIEEVWNEEEKYYVGIQTPGIDYFTLENIQGVPLVQSGTNDE